MPTSIAFRSLGPILFLSLIGTEILLIGCSTPVSNDDNSGGNNGGDISGEIFPFDVDIGRTGALAFNVDGCDSQNINVTTGMGSLSAGAIGSTTVLDPSIFVDMVAPKNTNSTVTVADCSLGARFSIVPGSEGLAFADGTIRADVRVEADFHGAEAKNYIVQLTMGLAQVSEISPDLVGQDLGSAVKEYCLLDLACNDRLPDDGNFRGVERFSLALENIDFRVGREYSFGIGMTGSLTAVSGIPDIGGEVDVKFVIESLTLDFDSP